MIESGIADYAVLIPNQLLSRLEENPKVSVSSHQSGQMNFIFLNTKKHPTDNLWVRRAIASSLNRKTLVNYIYKNTAVEPKGLIPQSIILYRTRDSLISFDLDLAKHG